MKSDTVFHKFVSRSGVEMVEMAIAFPLFCLMVLGTAEVCWLLYQQNVLDYATRQGARFASVDKARALEPNVSTDISSEAKSLIQVTVTQFGGRMPNTFSLTWPDDRTFALSVQEDYTPVAGKLIPYISNINKISSTATMYCEACG